MNAIPRVALVWLLVAQVLVILPHLAYMPLWIAAMWLGCAAWRVQVFRMRAGYPRAWVKLALAQWWWATCSTTVSSPRCTACCR